MDLSKLPQLARVAETNTKKLFEVLKRKKPNNLDDIVHQLHEEAFEKIDCMKCANCCKTTSPIFYDRDIDRVAKRLRVKPSDFISKYLHQDEDGDYVLNEAPCTFLDSENYCLIYEDRPTACREYPHTDRKNMFQILELTAENTLICPAVARIVKTITERT